MEERGSIGEKAAGVGDICHVLEVLYVKLQRTVSDHVSPSHGGCKVAMPHRRKGPAEPVWASSVSFNKIRGTKMHFQSFRGFSNTPRQVQRLAMHLTLFRI